MSQQRIAELLDALRSELAGDHALDEPTRERLEALSAAIDARIAAPPGHPPADPVDALIIDFEIRHPRIAAVVEEVVATLARMGI